MQLRGRLKMKVQRVVLASGRALTAAQLQRTGRFRNGKFVDPAFGIALEVPAGCSHFVRGTRVPGKRTLPKNTVAVFADRPRGIAIGISSTPAPWADPLSGLGAAGKAHSKDVPGGRLFVRKAPNARIAHVITPGAIFKLDLRVRSAKDARLLDQALKTLKVGKAVDKECASSMAP
jgi:hypothetical protein